MSKLLTSITLLFMTGAYGAGFENKDALSIKKNLERLEYFGNKTTTTAGRARYVKELYYSVNGYPSGVTNSSGAQPHLQLFNQIMGANGIGGVLYESGFKACSEIPTTGTASGTVDRIGTLNLSFGVGTKIVPSYYQTDASTTMNKRITITGGVSVEIELKCNVDNAIQTGYVKLNFSQDNVVYEGYFQQNSTTGAVNVDMYIKTQTGGGHDLIIPTQFSTTNGESFTIFSGYVYPGGAGGGQDYLVAVNGVTNGNAQINFLQTTDTSGAPVTTAPQNITSGLTGGGTTAASECIDVTNEVTATGCTAIPTPGTLTIGGSSNTWTLTTIKAISL